MAGLPASIPANEAEAHHPALLPMVVSTLHCFLWLSEHPTLLPTPVSMAAVEPAAAERAEGGGAGGYRDDGGGERGVAHVKDALALGQRRDSRKVRQCELRWMG